MRCQNRLHCHFYVVQIMKFTLIPLAVLSLLLSACVTVTPEEAARRRAQEQADQQARQQAQLNMWRNRCTSYGYQMGTDAFASCVQSESLAAQDQATRERRERERLQREQREQREREQQARQEGEGCTLFEHPKFRGKSWAVPRGASREFVDHFNDKASSVRVAPGCSLVAYEHVQFQGASRVFTNDDSEISRPWDDQISSMRCLCSGR